MPQNPFQNGLIRSFVDIGSETLVNGETLSNQQNASIAVLSNGNYVVSWQSNLQDGSGQGIFSRLYSPDGVALTGDQAQTPGVRDHRRVVGAALHRRDAHL